MEIASTAIRRPLLTIRASKGFAAINMPEIWQFRELLSGLARRDVKLRYRQTALGVIWVVLQPLMTTAALFVVFGKIAKLPTEGLNPFLFIYSSNLAWNAFANTLTKASSCLVGNANLVSKVYFPRLILPLSIIPSTLIDFAVAAVVLVPLMFMWHIHPSFGLLLLPVWLFLMVLMSVGIGLYASALMVSYRDVQFILPVAVQILFFCSPIAYSTAKASPIMQRVFLYNPLTEILVAFRWSLFGTTQPPSAVWLAYSAGLAFLLFVLGAMTFKRMERRFADVI
jgi:lipopolysaccharide transport system permease protein